MAVTDTTFEGYLKNVEGKLESALAPFAKVQRDIPFDSAKAIGKQFVYPVLLRQSHGVTFAQLGTAKRTAYTLNDPVTAETQEVTVDGAEFNLQEDIAYGMIAAARNGEIAFGNVVDQILLGMRTTAQFYLEMMLLYGRQNIGEVESHSDTTGTAQSVVISQATWSPGLWAMMEGAYIDVYDDDGDPKRNAAGTILVTAVDPDTRTVYFTGSDETEIDTIVAGDIIVPRGWYGTTAVAAAANNFIGLRKIASHTSGALFGPDADSYGLWKSNTLALSSTKLTLAKIQTCRTKMAVRGATDDVDVLLNDYSWADINNDLSALRMFADNTKSEMTQGTDKIKFYSNGATLSLVPHPMIKAGEAILYTPSKIKRIGESDLKSQWDKDAAMHLESKAGVRFRNFWSQAIVPLEGPSRCGLITGIVPESI